MSINILKHSEVVVKEIKGGNYSVKKWKGLSSVQQLKVLLLLKGSFPKSDFKKRSIVEERRSSSEPSSSKGRLKKRSLYDLSLRKNAKSFFKGIPILKKIFSKKTHIKLWEDREKVKVTPTDASLVVARCKGKFEESDDQIWKIKSPTVKRSSLDRVINEKRSISLLQAQEKVDGKKKIKLPRDINFLFLSCIKSEKTLNLLRYVSEIRNRKYFFKLIKEVPEFSKDFKEFSKEGQCLELINLIECVKWVKGLKLNEVFGVNFKHSSMAKRGFQEIQGFGKCSEKLNLQKGDKGKIDLIFKGVNKKINKKVKSVKAQCILIFLKQLQEEGCIEVRKLKDAVCLMERAFSVSELSVEQKLVKEGIEETISIKNEYILLPKVKLVFSSNPKNGFLEVQEMKLILKRNNEEAYVKKITAIPARKI